MKTCPNCPEGYDCATGNYYTGDVLLVTDPETAHTEALYEEIYRQWPEPMRACRYPECECDSDVPCRPDSAATSPAADS